MIIALSYKALNFLHTNIVDTLQHFGIIAKMAYVAVQLDQGLHLLSHAGKNSAHLALHLCKYVDSGYLACGEFELDHLGPRPRNRHLTWPSQNQETKTGQ